MCSDRAGGQFCSWCGQYRQLQPWGGDNGERVCVNTDCPGCHPKIYLDLLAQKVEQMQKALAEGLDRAGQALVNLNNSITLEHNRLNDAKGEIQVLQAAVSELRSGTLPELTIGDGSVSRET